MKIYLPDNSPDADVPSRIGPATNVFEQRCPSREVTLETVQ